MIAVGTSVVVAADAPIHAGSRGEVVEIDPAAYDGMTHKVQLTNYWLWFRPRHLDPVTDETRVTTSR